LSPYENANEPVADTLFNADLYGPGRPERKRSQPDTGRRVQNRGDWHIVVRRGKPPYPLAHRLAYKMTKVLVDGKWHVTAWSEGKRWEGGWVTRCGLVGATVELPEGPVQACEKCCKR
jgi:hypothetical protein